MSYRRFFLVRLAWALVGVVLAIVVVFVVLRVVPPDPARLVLVEGPPDGTTRMRDELRTGDPLPEQFVDLIRRVVGESPGLSVTTRNDAREMALDALPATVSLLAVALTFWVLLGGGLGLLAARHGRHKAFGRSLVYLAIGLSPVWIGLWLSYFIAYKAGLVPLGYCDFFNPPNDAECGGGADWIRSLILPGFTLAIFFAAIYARVIACILRVPGEVSGRRRALVIARMFGRDVGYALGAAALVEVVFGVPGLGATLVASVEVFDLPVIESVLLVAIWLAIGIHFLLDVVVGALDSDLRAEWPVASVTGRA